MFGLESIADYFDKLHEDNKRFLRLEFQEWVNDVYRSDGEGWKFYATAATAATAEALYTVAGGLGAGLVDTLRLGEGVKKGSAWGVVEDGLRLTAVAGGAFRVFRVAMASAEIGGAMSCVVSSSAKAGMLTGRFLRLDQLFNRISTLAGGRKVVVSPNFPGLPTPQYFVDLFRLLGGRVTNVAVKSVKDVVELARTSNQPIVFAVWWKGGGGHAMVAFRDLLGRVRFADQLGRLMNPAALPAHTIHSIASIFHEAAVLKVMRFGAVGHFIAAQLHDLNPEGMYELERHVREELRIQKQRQRALAPRPVPRLHGTLTIDTFTTCFRPNSDMQEICTPHTQRTYRLAPGETLGSIARLIYGNADAWQAIYAANRAAIGPNPSYVKAGTTLVLP
jgi:nucleoid-associated protein YgaU